MTSRFFNYEETRANCCTGVSCVAGRGATTAAGCRRPDKHIATPQYRCYLQRGNCRHVLQRTQQPEPWWLRINRRVRIERWCRQQHVVHPNLSGVSAGQRIVQLTVKAVNRKAPHCCRLLFPKRRYQMICTYSRTSKTMRQVINKAKFLVGLRCADRRPFNSSIADAPNRCSPSAMAGSFCLHRVERRIACFKLQ
jgi:hypothetical protein